MNKTRILLCLFLLGTNFYLRAQNSLQWHNPAHENFRVVQNQLWYGNQIQSFYDRLPAVAEKNARKAVWNLSKNAAGLKLIFNTDAEKIVVRYTTSKKANNYAMLHFPATGVSGVDLFAENTDGSWAWTNGSYQFEDTITYTFSGLDLDKIAYKNGRNFHLYLPLYNNITYLEIGVPKQNSFHFIPVSDKKPIIVYGTSIAQGGCASRAGMAWTNILNRKLHIPVVNLGFSGNGKLEKEVIDMIATHNAEIFILDCLPNLGAEVDKVKEKTFYAVNTLRQQHPNTPIILVDQSHYTEGRLNSKSTAAINKINDIAYRAYQDLKLKGVQKIYYLKREDIGLTMDDSVDGTHPTDIGMIKYAVAYEKMIKEILNKK